MDLGIRTKVAVVAAASQGLGNACALALAKEGARLVICSRREKEIGGAAREIAAQTGAEVVPVAADMTKQEDIDRLVRTAIERFGTVHILVNNAGGPPAGDILAMSDQDWEKGVQLTLMSMVRCTRAVLPLMVKQKWGRIITITSIAAKQPINELLISSTLRPGLQGLTRVLSSQNAMHNITVNTIAPGFVMTNRQKELSHTRAAQRNMSFEEYIADQASTIPAGRLGEPEEVGNVVAFLASERASYINGVNLLVDGGLARGIH